MERDRAITSDRIRALPRGDYIHSRRTCHAALQVDRGLAAVVLAAGCGGDGSGGGGITPTGPMLLVGPTATVTVNCPTPMETGTSSTCTAYGYDANNIYTNNSVSSWSSSNTSVATITSGGAISAVGAGTTTISAVIDGVTGTRGVTVVNPAPLSVTMGGPTSVKPNVQCYWWANTSGGTPCVRVELERRPQRLGVRLRVLRNLSQLSGSFTVSVTVTDANGATATATKLVTVSTLARTCPV